MAVIRIGRWAWLWTTALLLCALGAQAWAAGAEPAEAPALEWFRSLTWPAAIAAALYSPPARAIADSLKNLAANMAKPASPVSVSMAPAPIAPTLDLKTLLEITQSLERTAELLQVQGRILDNLRDGMTKLLERSERARH